MDEFRARNSGNSSSVADLPDPTGSGHITFHIYCELPSLVARRYWPMGSVSYMHGHPLVRTDLYVSLATSGRFSTRLVEFH